MFSEKKGLHKIFSGDLKRKKKVFNHIFQLIAKKNGLQEHFSSGLQSFNVYKNSAVLEDNFWWLKGFEAKAKVKNFKMFP